MSVWVYKLRTLWDGQNSEEHRKGNVKRALERASEEQTGHDEDLCELIYLVYPKTLLMGFLPAKVILLNPRVVVGLNPDLHLDTGSAIIIC